MWVSNVNEMTVNVNEMTDSYGRGARNPESNGTWFHMSICTLLNEFELDSPGCSGFESDLESF